MSITLSLSESPELKPHILVFGVGGAGGNAVNNMIASELGGVEFVAANTDAQALRQSSSDGRLQLGARVTEGLGAGSHPGVGRTAAEESLDEIKERLERSHMVFITAGMGGGTGTGAAPVIAHAAREMGILTVGVVTKPFEFEGRRKMRLAEEGIRDLAGNVDTLIVIPNQNLFHVANEKTSFAEAFSMADRVLYEGVASITDLMTREGLVNLDFADVRSVMTEMGRAMMGTGSASGDKRALEAAESAIANPLLDDVALSEAKGLLISVSGSREMTLFEINEAVSRVSREVDEDVKLNFGATYDESLGENLKVSVIATGMSRSDADERGVEETSPSPSPRAAPPTSMSPPTPMPPIRLPDVSDFPPIAQREYAAKRGATSEASSASRASSPRMSSRPTLEPLAPSRASSASASSPPSMSSPPPLQTPSLGSSSSSSSSSLSSSSEETSFPLESDEDSSRRGLRWGGVWGRKESVEVSSESSSSGDSSADYREPQLPSPGDHRSRRASDVSEESEIPDIPAFLRR